MIFTIARREFQSLFLSPLAWSVLAVIQFILAYLFLTQIETFIAFQSRLAQISHAPSITDIIVAPLFSNAAVILLLVTPLLTMRTLCEERRNKTLTLLLSAPLSTTDIVLGKYLSIIGLLTCIVAMTGLMSLSLLFGGELDFGKWFCNLLGLLLLTAAFAALGLYLSSLASHPTIAAIGSFGLLLLLWIIDWKAGLKNQSSDVLEYISMLRHFQNLQSGLLDSQDVLYFVLFCATFLILSIFRLEYERLQK